MPVIQYWGKVNTFPLRRTGYDKARRLAQVMGARV